MNECLCTCRTHHELARDSNISITNSARQMREKEERERDVPRSDRKKCDKRSTGGAGRVQNESQRWRRDEQKKAKGGVEKSDAWSIAQTE